LSFVRFSNGAFGYNKGTTVFIIDDAEGSTWIMKGFELGIKPRWTYDEFAADPASKFKQLPPGWRPSAAQPDSWISTECSYSIPIWSMKRLTN
jgi:hypothetical protein